MPMNGGGVRTWTDEQDDKIKTLLGKVAYSEIAKQIGGVSRNAVIGRARRLGLAGTPDAPIRSKGNPGKPRTVKKLTPLKSHVRVSVGLGQTSQNERAGGMGLFKEVKLTEPVLDLPNLWCEPVDLLELKEHHCRWPMDGGKFCGLNKYEPEYGATSYCRAHYSVSVAPRGVYRKPLVARR